MIPILKALIRKQFCLFFLLFNFQLVSSDIFAQSANDVMQELMKETGSVGMSVAVVKKGKLIFTDTYGYRDLENKKLNSTFFSILFEPFTVFCSIILKL
mgnify:CR=1 FL=1